MERGPPEDVHVGVGGGLGERDLAGRRARGERRRDFAGLRGDPGADVRQAGAALAGPETGLAGAFEEFQFGEAPVPGGLKVRDGRAHAAAHDALGRGRREGLRDGRVPDDGQWHLAGHPRQQVARGQAKTKHDRVGRGRRSRTGPRVPRHDRGDAARRAFERKQVTDHAGRGHAVGRCPDRDHPPEIDPSRVELLRGTRRDEPGESIARADRPDLGGAGRHDDLVRLHVEHPGACPRHDHRPRVDRHDLLAGTRVEHEDRLAGAPSRRSGGLAARPTADDGDIDGSPTKPRRRARSTAPSGRGS